MLKKTIKQILPNRIASYLSDAKRERERARRKALTPLTEEEFRRIVEDELEVGKGSIAFIHSGIGGIRPGFTPDRVIELLLEIVGDEGTLLFPTYPKLTSYEFLLANQVTDIRTSKSYTGILSEKARTHPEARRSLHPTKSVCAIGKYAKEMTATHQDSPYPYDACSPYYKAAEYEGRIVGLGVPTTYMSFAHCADDYLKDEFPVQPYLDKLFDGRVIDYEGKERIIKTYTHDKAKMLHDVPKYVKRHLPDDICRDVTVKKRSFFTGDAARLFEKMVELAREGITMYPRSVYK